MMLWIWTPPTCALVHTNLLRAFRRVPGTAWQTAEWDSGPPPRLTTRSSGRWTPTWPGQGAIFVVRVWLKLTNNHQIISNGTWCVPLSSWLFLGSVLLISRWRKTTTWEDPCKMQTKTLFLSSNGTVFLFFMLPAHLTWWNCRSHDSIAQEMEWCKAEIARLVWKSSSNVRMTYSRSMRTTSHFCLFGCSCKRETTESTQSLCSLANITLKDLENK